MNLTTSLETSKKIVAAFQKAGRKPPKTHFVWGDTGTEQFTIGATWWHSRLDWQPYSGDWKLLCPYAFTLAELLGELVSMHPEMRMGCDRIVNRLSWVAYFASQPGHVTHPDPTEAVGLLLVEILKAQGSEG